MSYGRNVEFRSTPKGAQRAGRYFLDSASPLAIGVPVVLSGDSDAVGRLGVELATGETPKPLPGQGGVLFYEHIQFIGEDPLQVTYSDFDTAPAGAAVQVVNGTEVKIGYKNTTDDTFLIRTGYPHARVMVANVVASSGVAVGDMVTPGAGDDDDGYWAVTSTEANAWGSVTFVNVSTGEVEIRLNF